MGFSRSFDPIDEIISCNLHVNATGDDGKSLQFTAFVIILDAQMCNSQTLEK